MTVLKLSRKSCISRSKIRSNSLTCSLTLSRIRHLSRVGSSLWRESRSSSKGRSMQISPTRLPRSTVGAASTLCNIKSKPWLWMELKANAIKVASWSSRLLILTRWRSRLKATNVGTLTLWGTRLAEMWEASASWNNPAFLIRPRLTIRRRPRCEEVTDQTTSWRLETILRRVQATSDKACQTYRACPKSAEQSPAYPYRYQTKASQVWMWAIPINSVRTSSSLWLTAEL